MADPSSPKKTRAKCDNHPSMVLSPAMEHGLVKRILTWDDLFNWEIQRKAA